MKKETHDPVTLENRQLQEKVGLLEKKNKALRQQLKSCQDKLAAKSSLEKSIDFSELIDALPTPVYVTDAEGRLTHYNPAAIDFAGRVPELGKDRWCISWKLFYPDGKPMPHDECPMATTLKKGLMIQEAEAIAELPDGSRRWFAPHPRPLFDSNGEVIGGINILVDISNRKQAEMALQASEERYRLLVENASEGIWQLDSQFRIVDVNERMTQLLGYSKEEIIGRFGREFVVPEDIPEAKRRMATGWEGPSESFEIRLQRKHGSTLWVLVSAAHIRDNNGNIIGTCGMFTDFTHHKKMEGILKKSRTQLEKAKEAAEAASCAKSEFLAKMSHEIRTPMTVFLGALDHLKKLKTEPEQRNWLEMADKSAHRLRSLIDDILDFSRIEARQVEIHEEPFSLRPCVQDSLDLLDLAAKAKDLALKMDIPPEIPEIIIADKNRLNQILVNLIGNAIKFTERGEVAISLHSQEGSLVFAVRDTGPGIPEEQHSLLFHSFSQLETSSYYKQEGTGLGLAICKGLVELMGGQISLESRSGEGSTFFFSIPLKTPPGHEGKMAKKGAPKFEKFPQGNVRILLVEDEPLLRDMISMILNQRGHHIETAENGEEAISTWSEGNYDLILMDMQMPGMNGIEAASRIRRLEKENAMDQIPIVALSADVRKETREKCQAAGMDGFLSKPINFEALYAAVENARPLT